MKLILKTEDGNEVELEEKEFDASKDKVTVFQLPIEDYPKEAIQAFKGLLDIYFPNVIIINNDMSIKQFKIEK